MSDLDEYFKAMVRGDIDACSRIEKNHDLYGYSPEIVSIGLKALAEGRCPHGAIDNHLAGGE